MFSLVHAIIFTAILSELKSTVRMYCMQKFSPHLAIVVETAFQVFQKLLGMSGSKMMQMVL